MRLARTIVQRRGGRGLALIVVLWASALMVLLGGSFAFSLRTEARLAMTVIDRAAAAAAADAGLQRLQLALVTRDRRSREPLRGEMTFDGFQVEIAALPENGRVDLNAAPPALLLGLIEHAVATAGSQASAAAIVDAILDWRDADDNRRPDGAEVRDYESAGLTARPRNGAFLSVTELSQVKGVEAELFRVLKPLVTVYAWSPQVDAMSAGREVLLALPGVDEAQVDAFISARPEGPAALSMLAGAGRYVARSGGSIYSLVARARASSGVVVSRRLVVKLTGNAERPVSVIAWFSGLDADESPAAPDDAATGASAAGS